MTMNPVSRSLSDEDKALIEQYLKNGGNVTVGKYSIGTQTAFYNNKKAKQEPEGND